MPEIAKCKSCGSKRYQIQRAYSGYNQILLAVECGDCKHEIIPVVVDQFMREAEVYAKCEAAWNDANSS